MVAQRILKSIGFEIWASMPAAVVAAISSEKALAVTAIMGICLASGRFIPRIYFAVSQPPHLGHQHIQQNCIKFKWF